MRPKISDNLSVASVRPSRSDFDEPSWAHVSGWAQLAGAMRTISCVISTRDRAAALSQLLPDLSDALTEAGYPWEVVVVDNGSTDATDALLSGWTEIPGFRSITLAKHLRYEEALAIGLQSVRGDAVFLLAVDTADSLRLLSQMVGLWEGGAHVVAAPRERRTGVRGIRTWTSQDLAADTGPLGGADIPAGLSELMLIDRTLTDRILNVEGSD